MLLMKRKMLTVEVNIKRDHFYDTSILYVIKSNFENTEQLSCNSTSMIETVKDITEIAVRELTQQIKEDYVNINH